MNDNPPDPKNPPASHPEHATRSTAIPSGRRVLLVEDDERVARAESWILEQAGFAVTVAGTGTDGLALARAELPMAVILDGDLPGLDGFEVCRRLKADPKTRHIPVLFCSGRFDSRELARAAGANDSVEKTDAVAELVERLNRLLGL